jgi:hypothetical protein
VRSANPLEFVSLVSRCNATLAEVAVTVFLTFDALVRRIRRRPKGPIRQPSQRGDGVFGPLIEAQANTNETVRR